MIHKFALLFRSLRWLVHAGFCYAWSCLHRCSAMRKRSGAQRNLVTAIDIALEPDATMIQRAQADNARLLKAPKRFCPGSTHHPHVTMLHSSSAPLTSTNLRRSQQSSGRREADKLEAESVQVLLHPVAADWSCGHRR